MTDRFRKIQDAQKLRLQRIATAASSVSSSSAASLQPAPLCDPRLGWCFNDALNNMDRNRYSVSIHYPLSPNTKLTLPEHPAL